MQNEAPRTHEMPEKTGTAKQHRVWPEGRKYTAEKSARKRFNVANWMREGQKRGKGHSADGGEGQKCGAKCLDTVAVSI